MIYIFLLFQQTGTEFRCRCPNGFGGKRCEIEAKTCAGRPCENGGRCVNTDDGYLCECPSGYSGSNCQNNINECSSNPCQNKGKEIFWFISLISFVVASKSSFTNGVICLHFTAKACPSFLTDCKLKCLYSY